MKTLIRTFLLLTCFLFTVFFRQDAKSIYHIPKSAESVATADLDLDGFNDIVVGHTTIWSYTNPTLTFLKNIFYGTFAITDTSKVFCSVNESFAIDVNNDGYPDIIRQHNDASQGSVIQHFIRIYFNSLGSFAQYSDMDLSTNYNVEAINHGDINGDGFEDLVATASTGQFWEVLYNNGTGHYSTPQVHSVSFPPVNITCGDLNNDGRDDVLVCGYMATVFFSKTSGFQSLVIGDVGVAGIADFDQDGYNDILSLRTFGGLSHFAIYQNNGNESFTKEPDIDFNYTCDQFVIGDFNNDGLPDVLMMLDDFPVYLLYYNQGNFQFASPQYLNMQQYVPTIMGTCCADLDNNGYIDIVTVSSNLGDSHSILNILFNDGNGNFGPDPIVGIPKQIPDLNNVLTCFPNPFHETITFKYVLKSESLVDFSIFDLQGKFLTHVISRDQQEGSYSITWNGLDNGGQPCNPGAYLGCLRVGGKISGVVKIVKL
jgi:hypothetical protein